jgi:alpha-1,3-rhamnosyl/mannosyltransferase
VDLLTGARGDFFLFPNFVRWPLALCRHSAVVVHDLSYIHSTATMTSRLRTFLARKVPASMARSDLVFTPSATIRKELLDEYRLDPARVIVASPAADGSAYFPRSAPQCVPVLDEYSLRWRKFILFVGTIEPRKNIERLLDAYGRLSADLRADFPLVLAGGKGWVDDAIYRKLQDLRREGLDLRLLGYVPLERLPFLYSSCAVFAFPSLYEGFGMPLLEAMACGAPAVTSSISSLPEVAGDAGILVDPLDSGAIAAGIERVLRDADLAERMRAAGLRQAGKFSWEASAEVVLAAMESILDGPGKGTAKR